MLGPILRSTRRGVDGALACMSEEVSWPKASEGGRAVGKDAIPAYWMRQWHEFDPYLKPIEVINHEGGRADVRVRQFVKSLDGGVLSDSEVWHVQHRERPHRTHGSQGRRR